MKTKLFTIISLSLILALVLSVPVQAKKVKEPVDRGVFIDYAKAKGGKGGGGGRGGGGGKGGPPTDQSRTYKYSGVHWEDPDVEYRVDQASSGMDPAAALSAVQAGFNTWETEFNPFGLPDMSIIDYSHNPSPVTNSGGPSLDGENSISWGKTPSGAIAVTYYWYYRAGKRLVETDMILSNELRWSTTGASTAYDVQNIVTHEAGHTLVLLDLYNTKDSELTMYGYGSLGETKKRDLGIGDMLGVERIYPSP